MPARLERLHFMDSMRAVLMMLGVVLHSAQVFNPEQTWLIYSQNGEGLMAQVVSVISTFRMPAFFVVSGYFCYRMIARYDALRFLGTRLKRLVIPFVCVALIVNSFQATFLSLAGWQQIEIREYAVQGGYISHLWFLVNLSVYIALFALLGGIFKPWSRQVAVLTGNALSNVNMLLVLFLLPLCSVGILGLNKVGFPLYSNFFGVFSAYSLLVYLPFFVFGAVIAIKRDFIDRFCKSSPAFCVLVIASATLLVSQLPDSGGLLFTVAHSYLSALAQWFSVLLCFVVFYRFFDKPSAAMQLASESSYTVYLFHQLLVVLLGALLIYLEVSAVVGWLILVVSVTGIALLIHKRVIARHRVLCLMFNGK
ncbi:MAG: acyltransferase family protein [Alteromonadaceae bacterium]|nr:acyltransferase family protein [Alteromonadaceae bacterium]